MDDVICCALTNKRTVETIYHVLNYYIPGYEQLPGDYGVFGLSSEITFPDEERMLRFCVAAPNLSGSFFWNKYENNPREIMVGAILTSDGQLVMSLTMPAMKDCRVEESYLVELQRIVDSDCGVIYGNVFPEFKDGANFRKKYQID